LSLNDTYYARQNAKGNKVGEIAKGEEKPRKVRRFGGVAFATKADWRTGPRSCVEGYQPLKLEE